VCLGDIDAVNAYFLQNTLVLEVLGKIAEQNGKSPFGLLCGLEFYWHHKRDGREYVDALTGEQIGYRMLAPTDVRHNVIPWVIVYEPMIYTRLGEGGAVFFTATEYALTQGTIYNWHTFRSADRPVYTYGGRQYETGRLPGQCMQSMAFRMLPRSVMLTEPWFGFPAGDGGDGSQALDCNEILREGGWGMGFLSPKPAELIDLYEERDIHIAAVAPNSDYRSGRTVITSFRVTNRTAFDILPEDGMSVCFFVRDGDGNTVAGGVSDGLAVPSEESTLVWFEWTVGVPAGTELVCEAVVDTGGIVRNICEPDGLGTLCVTVAAAEPSRVSSAGYAPSAPAGFGVPASPPDVSASASWSYWIYGGDGFEFVTASASAARPEITLIPDSRPGSAAKSAGGYTVRSGYGFAIEAKAEPVCSGPDGASEACTAVQGCDILFPENGYSSAAGSYETAEAVLCGDGSPRFVFRGNPDDRDGGHIHYIPVWYPDGTRVYAVYVYFYDVWTPGGMIGAGCRSEALSVRGSLFDDWCVGRSLPSG
jgi:hypothetical protein